MPQRVFVAGVVTGLMVSTIGGALSWSPWLTFAVTVVPLLPARVIYRRWLGRQIEWLASAPENDEHEPVDLGAWVTVLLVVVAGLVGGREWWPLGLWAGVAFAALGADRGLRRLLPRATAHVDRVANAVYDRC